MTSHDKDNLYHIPKVQTQLTSQLWWGQMSTQVDASLFPGSSLCIIYYTMEWLHWANEILWECMLLFSNRKRQKDVQSGLQWWAFLVDFGICFIVKLMMGVPHFWEFTSKRIYQYTVKTWLTMSWKYSSFLADAVHLGNSLDLALCPLMLSC